MMARLVRRPKAGDSLLGMARDYVGSGPTGWVVRPPTMIGIGMAWGLHRAHSLGRGLTVMA
jgi:hypothetical protein